MARPMKADQTATAVLAGINNLRFWAKTTSADQPGIEWVLLAGTGYDFGKHSGLT